MNPLGRQQLDDALATRILVLDGAMGTMIQARRPTADDFGSVPYEGCCELLNETRPAWIADIHRQYLEAGADLIATNSFQGSAIVLAQFGLDGKTRELNRAAAALARRAADEFATARRPRFVAGSLGPTDRSLTLRRDVRFAQLRDSYQVQVLGLIEGGVDLLLVETAFDTCNVKAALAAIRRVERALGIQIPVMLSATVEQGGAMLAGQRVDTLWASVAHADLVSIGLNCATGPSVMTDHLRTLAEFATTRISCHPNAGLPDEHGEYLDPPDGLAAALAAFVDRGWLNIVGGCCGTTPAHIRAIAQMADGRVPHVVNRPSGRTFYSGVDLVEAAETTRPLLVAERANVLGSRLFKRLVAEHRWDEGAELVQRQVRSGAQIVDVCLQGTEHDEVDVLDPFYAALMARIRAPVMIDTTDMDAAERALAWCQGKSIINSIDLEDGERQFARASELAHAHGAAIVVATVDEDAQRAQAFTRERKLAIAQRAVALLTQQYGIRPEDIIIDPLVFPCASGDEGSIGGAVETFEAIRLIKHHIPLVKTIVSVSAVSFGLPDRAREVLHAVFLDHAIRAGVDLAMVNTEKLLPLEAVAPAERRLAEDLLFNTPPREAGGSPFADAPDDWRLQTREQKIGINRDHIVSIVDRFAGRAAGTGARSSPVSDVEGAPDAPAHGAPSLPEEGRDDDRSIDARLSRYVVDGTRRGLIEDLDAKLRRGARPIDIVSGPLMAGMAEVGRLFARNAVIVAEVLQSAETMNAAVRHLEPFIGRGAASTRGTIALATVKGDVHDIGKNLVEIVLTSHGYRVIDLGTRVAPETLIQACREHRPDVIGLSGLLVKSAHQMAATAAALRDAGIQVPLIVGGAALTAAFTQSRIAPNSAAPTFYASDAMAAVGILETLEKGSGVISRAGSTAVEPSRRSTQTLQKSQENVFGHRVGEARKSHPTLFFRPGIPALDRRVEQIVDLREIWTYINPFALYNRHFGFKGDFETRLAAGDPKAVELLALVDDIKEAAAAFMTIRAVSQFFEAEPAGDAVHLFAPGPPSPLHTFRFPRQAGADRLCLSDYVLAPENGRRDHLGVFVVTAGEGVREHADEAKAQGHLLRSHGFHALGVETAEAAAEWLHRRMRAEWGFPDPPGTTMKDQWMSRYRGKRYSFGYPACPDVEGQRGIWTLLRPEAIGVTLTDGFMMNPEASVSALVFHHPDCRYFAV